MIKRFKQLSAMIITVTVIINLSGCWDSRELNDVGIVMDVGLDKAEAPGEIEMTMQIAKAGGDKSSSKPSSKSKAENGGSSLFFNAKDTGPVVLSVVHKLTYTLSRKLELSQNQLIIFGEDLAKAGVRDSFDFFARSAESRMTVYIFVARGKAGDVLDTEPGFEKFPATEIHTLIEDPIGSIDKTDVLAHEFEQGLLSKTTSPVAPIIEVKEEGGKKQISISGCAVFKGDRAVGELKTRDSRGLQWVKGKVKYSALNVPFDGGLAEVIITSSKGKITPVIKDDGSVMIKLEIKAEGFMDSQTGAVNLAEPGNAKLLIKETERTIIQEVENTLGKVQELGTDIFAFGESVYRKYPREWKALEPQWDEIFKNIKVEIDVTAKVKGSGRLAKPLYPEKE